MITREHSPMYVKVLKSDHIIDIAIIAIAIHGPVLLKMYYIIPAYIYIYIYIYVYIYII